jgi:hypothetical protein
MKDPLSVAHDTGAEATPTIESKKMAALERIAGIRGPVRRGL